MLYKIMNKGLMIGHFKRANSCRLEKENIFPIEGNHGNIKTSAKPTSSIDITKAFPSHSEIIIHLNQVGSILF